VSLGPIDLSVVAPLAEAELARLDAPAAVEAVGTGKMGLAIPTLGFTIARVTQLLQRRWKRDQFRKRVPMSVFVDLSRKPKIDVRP
jgi:hypothetical protein